MAQTPSEVADALSAANVDPHPSVARMLPTVKALGVRGQTGTLKAGIVEYKRRRGLPVDRAAPLDHCRRADAARMLGMSVKRVDQLRREGRLVGYQHPFTRQVWITLDSVRTERRLRGLGQLEDPS
jgi:hypothetical protein